MKNQVFQRAIELGFDACRITSAASPDSSAHFERWLAQGRHGEMQYLARNAHKRVDPQLVLAGARSILTLAVSYYADDTEATPANRMSEFADSGVNGNANPSGVVARYARHADYHVVLEKPLRALCDFLVRLGGSSVRSLFYVDTGPLLERDLAQRAGVGFIGKHTNLISRKLGNWFFLAEILTTMELEPDEPEKNRCGSCTRCLAACPTSAITAPFVLDARRCISYLTIELKGSIPVELRPLLGNRIYGCDDCLEVCPWNRFAAAGRMLAPWRRADFSAPALQDLLNLDESSFRRRFAGTPILRTKRRGFLRNVCVALGNVGTTCALSALQKAASDPEPLIVEHAQWAIDRIEQREKTKPKI